MSLEFEPGYPVRVTSGGSSANLHPAAVETTRGLLALVYARNGEVWRTFSLDRGASWAEGQQFVSRERDPSYQPRARYNHRGGFALVFSGAAGERDIYFEEILEVQNVSDNLVSARIKRSTDASSKGCDLVISNPHHLYDPEVPNTKWSGVFQPGAPVEIKAGYGGEVLTRFKGYIDSVSIDDEEPVLSFSGRGEFKQLLDQSLRQKRYYQNKRRVAIIAELAGEAGIDPELVQIQDSPERVTAEYDREKTYESVMREQADALGFELLEPDEGGLVCREPSEATSTTPAWYFEEEENMYSREREWDDDEVYTRVQVYREDKLRDDGTVELAGFTAEAVVDTPFLTPAGKTLYEKADDEMTEARAQTIADALAVRVGREGSRVEVASWLHPALEAGDTVYVRRKSLGAGQEAPYVVEALDDDMAQSGFGTVVQARRIG